MIRVHLGVVDVLAMPGTEVVREPEDYIVARVAIRDSMRVGDDLDVFILTRVCDEWFWDLAHHPNIRLLQEDPVGMLCRKLRVSSLPPGISTPETISALGLLELPDPSEPVSNVAAWVTGHKLDEIWSISQPSYTHITQLIAWWANSLVPDNLRPIVEQRLSIWARSASGQLCDAYQALQRFPEECVHFLCCWKALKSYDEKTRIQWLEEEDWYFPDLQWLASKLGDLPIPAKAAKSLSLKAEAYWRRRLTEWG